MDSLHFNFFLLSIPTFWKKTKTKHLAQNKTVVQNEYFRNYIMRNDTTTIIVATKKKPKLFYSNSHSSLIHPLLNTVSAEGPKHKEYF